MKKICTLLCMLALGGTAYAHDVKETDVPATVKAKFAAMYPNVKDAKWEMEDGKYEAEFEGKNDEMAVIFDASGNILQTEVEVPVSSLPKGVKSYAKKNLSGKKIEEGTKITDANGTVRYEAEIGNADYMFDVNGKFLSKKSEGKEDDKDDDK